MGRLARTGAACAVALVTLACAGAPIALAAGFEGSGAGSKLTEGGTESTQTQTTATTSTTSTTNSKGTILIAGAAAIVLLGGIGFVIVRDARRIAPADEEDISEGRAAHETAVALRRRRAKAKAARRARRHNR